MTDTLLLDNPITPPRRYSVGMPGFSVEIGRRLRILADGVQQEQVVEYDCDDGIVLKNKLGADGRPMLNAERDAVLREIVRGNITVEWNDV